VISKVIVANVFLISFVCIRAVFVVEGCSWLDLRFTYCEATSTLPTSRLVRSGKEADESVIYEFSGHETIIFVHEYVYIYVLSHENRFNWAYDFD